MDHYRRMIGDAWTFAAGDTLTFSGLAQPGLDSIARFVGSLIDGDAVGFL